MYLLPMVETEPSFDSPEGFRAGLAAGALRIRGRRSSPSIDVTDFKQLVAWLKAHPDQATFGVPSNGTIPHFTGLAARKGARHFHDPRALSRQCADHQRSHRRPPAVRHHDAWPMRITQHRAGGREDHRGERAPTRSPFLPEVPTLKESGRRSRRRRLVRHVAAGGQSAGLREQAQRSREQDARRSPRSRRS